MVNNFFTRWLYAGRIPNAGRDQILIGTPMLLMPFVFSGLLLVLGHAIFPFRIFIDELIEPALN